jgi:hypothetical protein
MASITEELKMKITAKRISGGQTDRNFQGGDVLPLMTNYAWRVVGPRGDVVVVAPNRDDAIRMGRRHVR